MTDHDPFDPLCPWRPDPKYPEHNHCQCPLLAQARADERERIARAIRAYADSVDTNLADVSGYFGTLSTGGAVGIALAAAEGIARGEGR